MNGARGVSAGNRLSGYGWISLLGAGAYAVIILGFYHNRSWYPPDEGAYAHVAQRVLDGEVLNRDIQDIHAGYINFANAFSLWAFGRDLVSLRYPLVLMGVLQALITWWLVYPFGALRACVASITITSLGAIQFLNPTAHWYCLFLMICLIAVLSRRRTGFRRRDFLIGALLGVMFLMRQLSGVIAAIAVLSTMLQEGDAESEPPVVDGGPPANRSRLLVRALGVVMSLGITGFLAMKLDLVTLFFYGLFPAVLPVCLAWKSSWTNSTCLRNVVWLGCGFLCASLPLAAYHVYHHSVGQWFDDCFITALRLTEQDFIARVSFLGTGGPVAILPVAIHQLRSATSLLDIVNGCYWWFILFAPVIVGIIAYRRVTQQGTAEPWQIAAVIYFAISLHYQSPVYAMFSAGVVMVGLLISKPFASRFVEAVWLTVMLGVSFCAVWLHAALPASLSFASFVRGEHASWVWATDIDRCSLYIDAESNQQYEQLLEFIESHSRPGDAIFAFPVNPELYFLSQRKNPVRYFNSSLGVRSEAELEDATAMLRRREPQIVIVDPDDKYHTTFSRRLIEQLESDYVLERTIGRLDLYLPAPRDGNSAR